MAAASAWATANLNVPEWAEGLVQMQGDDWVAVTVRLSHLTMLIVFAYFHPGHECVNDNYNRFNAILRLKMVLRMPILLSADFNKTPQQIEEMGWAKLLESNVITPPVNFTCTTGSGRLVDFWSP